MSLNPNAATANATNPLEMTSRAVRPNADALDKALADFHEKASWLVSAKCALEELNSKFSIDELHRCSGAEWARELIIAEMLRTICTFPDVDELKEAILGAVSNE